MKKNHLIIQARRSSSRFPQKVLKKIGDDTLLDLIIKRVKKASRVNRIIIATSSDSSDDLIALIADRIGVDLYRGSLDDVLDRYYKAAVQFSSTNIIRITGDCPLIDPNVIDYVIEEFENNQLDYCSNTLDPKFPDGQDVEVFTFEALQEAWRNANLKSEREHVTPYIQKYSSFYKQSIFKVKNIDNLLGDFSSVRMTVDYEVDLSVIKSLIEIGGTDLSWKEYVDIIDEKCLSKENSQIQRNEGLLKSLQND